MIDIRDFVAGWIGGAAGVISSHPLDTVKVRLQTSNAYKGTLDCVVKTFQKEGAGGFLKGMAFPLASVAAYNAVVFGVYSNAERAISQYRYNGAAHTRSYLDTAVAAMLAGGISVAVGAPVDLVKIRLQAQTGTRTFSHIPGPISKNRTMNPGLLRRVNLALASNTPVTTVTMAHISTKEPYRGVFDCLVRIWKEEGLRGFYRGGAPAMIIRDIPGYAMYFVPYAILCDMFKSNVTGEPNALGYIMAGGFAGVISWGSAHPMDTLKSRIQLEGSRSGGVFNCAITMYRNDGIKVFFRGIGVNALRGFPQSAALFYGYEMAMKAMSTN